MAPIVPFIGINLVEQVSTYYAIVVAGTICVSFQRFSR